MSNICYIDNLRREYIEALQAEQKLKENHPPSPREIALMIAYAGGKGVNRWDVLTNYKEIRLHLETLGKWNEDTHHILLNLKEEAGASL